MSHETWLCPSGSLVLTLNESLVAHIARIERGDSNWGLVILNTSSQSLAFAG